MEYKEVEHINKEVIVKVKDIIHLKELTVYMMKFGFSVMEIQEIGQEINNYGEAYAAVKFFDAIRRKPKSFPKLVAALQHLGQEAIYEIFLDEIRKFFRNNQRRLEDVMALIKKEERDLSGESHQDDGSNSVCGSGTAAVGQGLLAGNGQPSGHSPSGNGQSRVIYRRTDRPPSDPPYRHVASDNQLEAQTRDTGGAALPAETPTQLDARYANVEISSLKANVYKMLGKALEETNTQEDDDEPWWNHIINNGDIDVSRKEQREIGKLGSPGVEFLDILDRRGYTLRDLERLFTQFQIMKAIDILHCHQNKVIGGNHSDARNVNNLNRNQDSKAEKNKTLNILPTQNNEGQDEQNRVVFQPLQILTKMEESNGKSDSKLVSQTSDLSLDSNCDNNLMSIEEEPIKGTIAVPAHGDQTSKQSQLNQEQEAQGLQYDRVHQFDNDPEALNQTSFIPLNTNQGGCSNDMLNTDLVEACENDENLDSTGLTQRSEGTNLDSTNLTHSGIGSGDTLYDSNNVEGPPGNIPLLSQLNSVNSNAEDQIQDPPVRPEGVDNVSARSFTTFERTNHTTGATYVPPSVSSVNTENLQADNSTEASNILTSGHFNQPGIIQDTDQQALSSDTKSS